jgi:hypothetical protein
MLKVAFKGFVVGASLGAAGYTVVLWVCDGISKGLKEAFKPVYQADV